MTQAERDRLVVLKKAQKKLITQTQAAAELELSERQVRRLLVKLNESGDKAVIHGLHGRASDGRIGRICGPKSSAFCPRMYRRFGPTLAGEYLVKKHKIRIGRETLRQIMMAAGLWRASARRWRRCTSGARAGVAAENWCNGTPPSTIGWKVGARSCI